MKFVMKFAAALVGALVAVLIIRTVANGIYGVSPLTAAAEAPAQAAAPPTPAAPAPTATPQAAAAAPAAPAVGGATTVTSIAVRLAAADAAAATSMRAACQTCHTFDKGGANRVGPNLWGVVTRAKGSVAGYAYSDAMKKKGGDWTFADLDTFLTAPKLFVPDTKMTFAGIADPIARANMVAYLRTLADTPVPLPTP